VARLARKLKLNPVWKAKMEGVKLPYISKSEGASAGAVEANEEPATTEGFDIT
jgi:hypothetical protein